MASMIAAQSPTAQTPGTPGTSRVELTTTLPFVAFTWNVFKDRTGRNTCRPYQYLGWDRVSVTATHGPLRMGDNFGPWFDLDLTLPKFFLRVEAKRLAQFRKDHLPTMDQNNANFTRIHPAIAREALSGEIIDCSDRLDTGETTTRDDEGEHALPPIRVGFDTRGFQDRDHPSPQNHRIAKRS